MSDLARYFDFLDELRESGMTNMYGASPYLEEEFGLGHKEASKVLLQWMRSFSHDKSPEQRAAHTEGVSDGNG